MPTDLSPLDSVAVSPSPAAPVALRSAWRAADVLAFALAVLSALGAKAGWLPELPW